MVLLQAGFVKIMSRSSPEPNQRLRWGVSSAGGPSHCFLLFLPERKGCMVKDPLLEAGESQINICVGGCLRPEGSRLRGERPMGQQEFLAEACMG